LEAVVALDHPTKPARLERRQQALQKVERVLRGRAGGGATAGGDSRLIQERGHTERFPLAEVLYFKAALKYITVRTPAKT
jgi:two-component system response regulator AlgR